MPPRDGADEVRSHNENPEQTAAFPDQISPMAPMPPMPAAHEKPDLVIQDGNLPATACQLRDLFAEAGHLFDRDGPVKLVKPAGGGPMVASPLSVNAVVAEAHKLCQPVQISRGGKTCPKTLPDRVARMYLDMPGEWNLPPLAGISTAPLLGLDGSIHDYSGYHRDSELWCCKVPTLSGPQLCSRDDAEAALRQLRQTFKTFPFADSPLQYDPSLQVNVVNLDLPPGYDESAFLVGLLTAVCRPSLWLAPGLLVLAPQVSGAGSGKGLLVRAICLIAFDSQPRAFTAGDELDKRIAAELVEAAPALFLDNLNNTVLRSDTLASVLTERPSRIRLLGVTRMMALNSTAFIAVTGNGLGVSEDLTRRFIHCGLDPRCEDPESRPFSPGFLKDIERRRADLLSAALTIWRFGRQKSDALKRGRPLGSFEDWCESVRDPLLTLGCRDPVEQIEVSKARDPYRQYLAHLFSTWNRCHGTAAIKASDIDENVRQIIDPHSRGRQFVTSKLEKSAGTRIGGLVLTRQQPIGKWGTATYALQPAGDRADGTDHRGHRAHRGPMSPIPEGSSSQTASGTVNEEEESVARLPWREEV